MTSPRNPRRGIVLLSTLVSLMLVVGLVALLQAMSLANVKALRRLAQDERARWHLAAVRELSRPLVAEAMLDFDGTPRLALTGAPYGVVFEGREALLRVERVGDGEGQPGEVGVSVSVD